jgi:S1-C subfamily serine protease
MRSLAILFGSITALAVALAATAAHAWDIEAMNATIDDTNFVVNRGCSGTLIDREAGLVLTVSHCVTDQYEIIEREKVNSDGSVTMQKVKVVRPGTVTQIDFKGPNEIARKVYVVKVVLNDPKLDLALLKSVGPLNRLQHAKIACEEPKRGTVAYVVGNPYGVLYSSVTKGLVSSVQRSYAPLGLDGFDDNPLMQVSSGVVGGNSGGAVYNDKGELIGVPVRASMVNEVVGLAVPLPDIKKFLMREGLDRLWSHCEKK